MKILLITLLAFSSVASAQYAASASGSTTAAAEINGKINHQEGSGLPASVNCTVGKDLYTDTATGFFYKCITTGTPGTWKRVTDITLPYGCAVGDPAGSALATGVLCYIVVPTAGTITGWDIVTDAGTATVDVWKIATGTAKPTVTNTITASAKPAISTGTVIHSTTLTGWTTSVAANDILGFNLDAVSTAKYITVNVQIAH